VATDNPRRARLRGLTKLLVGVGLLLLTIPFIASVLPPASSPGARPSPWDLTHDLSRLAEGEILRLAGHPVRFGYCGAVQKTCGNWRHRNRACATPTRQHSRQPAAARTPWRSLDPEFFVFVPRETRRGCQVREAVATARWPAGFDEACEGRVSIARAASSAIRDIPNKRT
jgi:ubiquinol-cytochrome c reductase iron-sulfur subunit